MRILFWLHTWGSPKFFYAMAGRLIPWLAVITLILFVCGCVGGLWLAPADYQQGDAFRIIYVHVPSAFLSMGVYLTMVIAAIISLVWRMKLADIVIKVSAPVGAWFTLLALLTGAIWGKPMWGTWWIWDARLTSELILLFIYLGIIAFQSALGEKSSSVKAVAILVLVGVVNIPIIHYSVVWWNTLHQGATLSKFAKPSMDFAMLWPLLVMIAAFLFYYLMVMLLRARCEILQRERRTAWVQELIK